MKTKEFNLTDLEWSDNADIGDGPILAHKRIGQILLPETPSNLCFGGPKRNRLFITASQSLYAVYVNAQGAHIC